MCSEHVSISSYITPQVVMSVPHGSWLDASVQDMSWWMVGVVIVVLLLLLLLLSTLPVRHWRVYTEGRACSRCLPIA